ncbi:MAG: hypothetical protein ACTSR2_00310 [Candidatus Hodarchaeales archaeon]
MIYRYLDRVYGSGDIYLRLAGTPKTYSSNSKVISGYSDLYVLMQKSYVAIYEQIELCDNINVGIDKLIAINPTNRVGLTEEARLTQKLLIGVSELLTTVSGILIGSREIFEHITEVVDSLYGSVNLAIRVIESMKSDIAQNPALSIGKTETTDLLSLMTTLQKLLCYRTIVDELDKILTDVKGLDKLRSIVDEFRKLR